MRAYMRIIDSAIGLCSELGLVKMERRVCNMGNEFAQDKERLVYVVYLLVLLKLKDLLFGTFDYCFCFPFASRSARAESRTDDARATNIPPK